ncbi:MAG: hypothetical protein JWP81_3206 [Ferruginibacter sp.]|nr:hypothetical protein [Ferruginibacter sp.]
MTTSNADLALQRQPTGMDTLLTRSAQYKTKRIALLSNNAAVTQNGISTRLALMNEGFNLVKLFSPEHGLNAAGEDGQYQKDETDHLTGLPVISLYGNRLAPAEADFKDVDMVLVDIPDVGCRFYTYLWTMTHVMEACAAFNVPIIIADRPNPTGGNLLMAEGPMLDEEHCASFIGRWRIPIRHCCTLGELALYFAANKISNINLHVEPVPNGSRHQNGNFIFTPTSPAIQRRSAAVLYPGMGLLEGINVNEGRGTDIPFELCGAPWINQQKLQEAYRQEKNTGIECEAISYTPTTGLYSGQQCNGLSLLVTDEIIFRPVQAGISLIKSILKLYPDHAVERLYPTVANPNGKHHLDKLVGIKGAFNKIKNEEKINTDVGEEWPVMMKDYLLYK